MLKRERKKERKHDNDNSDDDLDLSKRWRAQGLSLFNYSRPELVRLWSRAGGSGKAWFWQVGWANGREDVLEGVSRAATDWPT